MDSIKRRLRETARRSEFVQDMYEAVKNRQRAGVIQRLIPKGGVGAELGVHKGHLTPRLIAWTEPKYFYAVDPWELLGDDWEWAAGDKSTRNGRLRATKGIQSFIDAGTAEVVVASDLDFLASVPDETFDWVYVDTLHSYDHTMAELELLVDKVKPGGIIAGDDWRSDPSHRHHGVCQAVREYDDAARVDLYLADDKSQQWAAKVVA